MIDSQHKERIEKIKTQKWEAFQSRFAAALAEQEAEKAARLQKFLETEVGIEE